MRVTSPRAGGPSCGAGHAGVSTDGAVAGTVCVITAVEHFTGWAGAFCRPTASSKVGLSGLAPRARLSSQVGLGVLGGSRKEGVTGTAFSRLGPRF